MDLKYPFMEQILFGNLCNNEGIQTKMVVLF